MLGYIEVHVHSRPQGVNSILFQCIFSTKQHKKLKLGYILKQKNLKQLFISAYGKNIIACIVVSAV
jgi:hypothetical protein